MQRYFLELAYNGTDFFGWQRQPNVVTVQETIEHCLSKLHSNTPMKVIGCGRTDTGVHAHHYVLHVDLPRIAALDVFLFKLNRMLPKSIAIQKVYAVKNDLHARFDARSRTYRYFIHQRKNAFDFDRSWYVPFPLDFEAMNEAAVQLLGTQDFTSLSKLHTDVKTNICSVSDAIWVRTDEVNAFFEITADRFLRNMVRAAVGTLVDVGQKKIAPEDVHPILAKKNRQAASKSAPPQGLFLWNIEYDPFAEQ